MVVLRLPASVTMGSPDPYYRRKQRLPLSEREIIINMVEMIFGENILGSTQRMAVVNIQARRMNVEASREQVLPVRQPISTFAKHEVLQACTVG